MPKQFATVGNQRYRLNGAAIMAFQHQLDATLLSHPDHADMHSWNLSKRDEFLRALPPRTRWLIIEACAELIKEAAIVQESR